jgi:hypothetical protein
MVIPANVILIWTGTNASIPSGWTRETALDDKFPKAWGSEDPNVTGGNNTHTHTGSHSHTLNSHSHNTYSGQASENGQSSGGGTPTVSRYHTHGGIAIGNTSGGGLQSVSVTWGSSSNQPPYYEVIFIKPSSTPVPIPTGVIAYYNGASVPIGWYLCDGNNGTPNLSNKYLKGAPASTNAGNVGGGATHSHDVSHTHTVNSHSHSGNSAGYSGSINAENSTYDTTKTSAGHVHFLTLNSTTEQINSYSNASAGNTDNVEPAYKKLSLIQKNTTQAMKGLVALWLNSVSSIPKNWVLCDGSNGTIDLRDKFIKTSATLTENGTTGGSNTHGHTVVSHTHSALTSHSHTVSAGAPSASGGPGGSGVDTSSNNHTHSWTADATNASYSYADITASTVDNQPAYRTVAYIQLNKLELGGSASFLLNMI